MVPAVRDWAIGVPKPLTLVEPATRTGLERLGRVQRVTNSWERVYSQGRWERVYIQGKRVCLGFASSARPILGSIPHLMAVPFNLPLGTLVLHEETHKWISDRAAKVGVAFSTYVLTTQVSLLEQCKHSVGILQLGSCLPGVFCQSPVFSNKEDPGWSGLQAPR